MELYNELRENWERLYWDEGYSKKLAHDHANYESAEDDDGDFNPYRFVCAFFFYDAGSLFQEKEALPGSRMDVEIVQSIPLRYFG